MDETEIHIGSIYKLGDAKIEVTKPREPCYKLGIRFNDQTVVRQFWNSNKCGVYFKVIDTGYVTTEDKLILIYEAIDSPTIAEVYEEKKKKQA